MLFIGKPMGRSIMISNIYIYVCVCICIYEYIYIYICIYTYTYVYVYVYVFMHTHTLDKDSEPATRPALTSADEPASGARDAWLQSCWWRKARWTLHPVALMLSLQSSISVSPWWMYSRNTMLGRGMPVVEAPAASWRPSTRINFMHVCMHMTASLKNEQMPYTMTAYQLETKLERGARTLKDWTSVCSSSFDFLLCPSQRFQRQRISTVFSMSSMLCWAIKSQGRRTRVEAQGNLKPAANEGKAQETVKKASFKQPAIQVRIRLRELFVEACCWLGLFLLVDLAAARLASEPCTLRWMGMEKNTLMLQRHSVLSSKVELPAKLLDYFLCIWSKKAILINGVCICECEWSPTHACVCVRVHECERVFVCVCIIVYLQMTHYVTWMLLCVWHRACCVFDIVRVCVLLWLFVCACFSSAVNTNINHAQCVVAFFRLSRKISSNRPGLWAGTLQTTQWPLLHSYFITGAFAHTISFSHCLYTSSNKMHAAKVTHYLHSPDAMFTDKADPHTTQSRLARHESPHSWNQTGSIWKQLGSLRSWQARSKNSEGWFIRSADKSCAIFIL